MPPGSPSLVVFPPLSLPLSSFFLDTEDFGKVNWDQGSGEGYFFPRFFFPFHPPPRDFLDAVTEHNL